MKEIFLKPIVDLSLSDLACVALAALLVWGVTLILYGFYEGVRQRWRDY